MFLQNDTTRIQNSSGIYAFRNKLDGKIYVGQSKNVLTRKQQHEKSKLNNSRRFHNAMKKHTPKGFDWVVLEYCEKKELNEREAYWVAQLNSIHPNGYNLTSGGGAFQRHHQETKLQFSRNQLAKVEQKTHLFVSLDFIRVQTKRQIELGKRGEHSSQRIEVREMRNKTVRMRMLLNGKFFSHTAEEINKRRKIQIELYAKGLGKFQDAQFIERNRQLVREKLLNGTHHTQQVGWIEKSIEAHRHEMKPLVVAIRTDDGKTIEKKYDSLHEAERQLEADRSHISAMCSGNSGVITVQCKIGKIIKGNFGVEAEWNLEDIKKLPNSHFKRKMTVEVTIKMHDDSVILKKYDGQREACRQLEASPRAFRGVLRKEKYKTTKCNLGKIIQVVEVDAD
jgi:group I intron endonuclease